MKDTSTMKFQTLATIAASLFLTIGSQGEPPRVEKIVDILHEAIKSTEPLPLLEKAKAQLKVYRAKPGALAVGPRAKGAIRAEAVDRKQDAMERLNQAIAEVKAGRDPKAKIQAAIAELHGMGAMKR